MQVKGIVEALIKSGNKVKYHIRPDGGIRITEINGIGYSAGGAKGNQAARKMLNVALSAPQRSQRYAAGTLTLLSHKRSAAYPSLTKQEKKKLRKLSRIAKKVGSPRIGSKQARLSKGRHQGSLADYIASQKNNFTHALDIAYPASVDWNVAIFSDWSDGQLEKSIAFLIRYRTTQSDSAMSHAREILYRTKNDVELSKKDAAALWQTADNEILEILKEGHARISFNIKLVRG